MNRYKEYTHIILSTDLHQNSAPRPSKHTACTYPHTEKEILDLKKRLTSTSQIFEKHKIATAINRVKQKLDKNVETEFPSYFCNLQEEKVFGAIGENARYFRKMNVMAFDRVLEVYKSKLSDEMKHRNKFVSGEIDNKDSCAMSDIMSNRKNEIMSDRKNEIMSDRMGNRKSDRMNQIMSDRKNEIMSDIMSERKNEIMSDRMNEIMSDRMNDRMSDRKNEIMSDRKNDRKVNNFNNNSKDRENINNNNREGFNYDSSKKEKYTNIEINKQHNYNNSTQDSNTSNTAIKSEQYTSLQNSSYLDTEFEKPKSTFSSMQLFEEEAETQRRANTEVQERIEQQINELGVLVCDISMHIQAQGERLRRIDDCIEEGDSYVKRSLFEINRTWERVKGRRETMVKFFIFWIVICAFIFLFKKYF